MRTLLGYWDARRDGKTALPRANFDPVDLPRLLPNIYFIDRVGDDPFDIQFRLVGTQIAKVEGEITGMRLSTLIPPTPHTHALWDHYERVMAGDVCLRRETLEWQDRDFIAYDVLLLPMIRTGPEIDGALGMALYRISGEAGARSE